MAFQTQKELYLHLYLKRVLAEPNTYANQKTILPSSEPLQFGLVLATDWPVYDGRDPKSNLVARLQGLHAETGKAKQGWHASATLVFEGGSFKGSTLHLMGTSIADKEWAIVGGTGQLTLAQGVMYTGISYPTTDGSYLELEFRAIYIPITKNSQKDGSAVGGNRGLEFDIAEAPQRLESVMVRSGEIVDSIGFSYVDKAGKKQTAGPWGGKGGDLKTIVFAPGETLTKVSGTINYFEGNFAITSLTLATNLTTYETLGKGKDSGSEFSFPSKDGDIVVGFFGRAGLFLDAIGVYTRPN